LALGAAIGVACVATGGIAAFGAAVGVGGKLLIATGATLTLAGIGTSTFTCISKQEKILDRAKELKEKLIVLKKFQ
jgi:hypothetical protein